MVLLRKHGPVGKRALQVWPPPSPPRRIPRSHRAPLARTPRSCTPLPFFYVVIRDTLSICLFFCPLLLSFSAYSYLPIHTDRAFCSD